MNERDEEVAFAGRIEAWMSLVWLTTQRFSRLMDEIDVHAESWRFDAAGQTAVWDALFADARGATPPPRLAGVHARAVALLGQLAEAGRLYRRAVVEGDDTAVEPADDALESTLVPLREIYAELGRMR